MLPSGQDIELAGALGVVKLDLASLSENIEVEVDTPKEILIKGVGDADYALGLWGSAEVIEHFTPQTRNLNPCAGRYLLRAAHRADSLE